MENDSRKQRFFKIPQTKHNVRLNIMLALGLLLVLIGIFIKVGMSVQENSIFAWRPVLLLFSGVVCLFFAFAFMRSGFVAYLGLFLFLSGIIVLLIEFQILPFSYAEMWPSFLIASGLALFPAGLYRLKRLRTIYLFPAISMIVLGMFFQLFSTHIIPISFKEFVTRWWPFFLIGIGIALVVIFVVQQINAKDFPYLEDDSLVDGDEN